MATSVVRVGDTVRREAGPWTDTVHELLRHVRARGVRWVPEPLGRDEQGREVLSYVEGEVPRYPMPDWVWSEAVLARAAQMLREYHDATAGFPETGPWRLPAHEPAEVICHNDFAPYNLAFRDGAPAGAIDFDTASPGSRVWDLAHLAYRLVPLTAPSNPDVPPTPEPTRAARLERLCGAYGGPSPSAVREVVPVRLDELAGNSEHAEINRTDATYLRAHT